MNYSEAAKLRWQNPEYRKHMSKIHKGKHRSFATEFKKGQFGEKAGHWKSGRIKDIRGYILIYKPKHPFPNLNKYVFEHRLVMEKHLGRYLEPKECVHHINEIKDDNRIENLMLFKNAVYHFWFHKKGHCNPKGIIFNGRYL